MITLLSAGKGKLLLNHSTAVVTAMLIFSTALLLAWYSLNNQVYSPPHLSISGNGIGLNISPWGTSLLQIKWYARMERDEREKMIHMENVNWRARWKVIQADKPGQWLSLSLCEALESFQREEAFRYPGVRLSGLFQHSLRLWCTMALHRFLHRSPPSNTITHPTRHWNGLLWSPGAQVINRMCWHLPWG